MKIIAVPTCRRCPTHEDQMNRTARAVWMTKNLVMTVLILSAVTVGALTYVSLSGDENDNFRSTVRISTPPLVDVVCRNTSPHCFVPIACDLSLVH